MDQAKLARRLSITPNAVYSGDAEQEEPSQNPAQKSNHMNSHATTQGDSSNQDPPYRQNSIPDVTRNKDIRTREPPADTKRGAKVTGEIANRSNGPANIQAKFEKPQHAHPLT